MIDITKLTSDGLEAEYQGDKFKILPLSVREQAKFGALNAQEKYAEASEYMFVTTVKKAFPTWTDDQILGITDKDFINLVTSRMMEVNGFITKKKE
jgi:hypothetical protein